VATEGGTGLSAEVDAFLTYARVERGLAPKTVEAYARDLARFGGFLEGQGVLRLRDARREHLTGFVACLERDGLGARSRARALVSVRRLLRHAGPEAAAIPATECTRLASRAGYRGCWAVTKPSR
jgi:integrase/recombinase XerD